MAHCHCRYYLTRSKEEKKEPTYSACLRFFIWASIFSSSRAKKTFNGDDDDDGAHDGGADVDDGDGT